MDEKEKAEGVRQAQKDAERVRAFQVMVKSDGWRFFRALLDLKIEEKTDHIFERPKGMDDLRGEDHDKGACYGLLWARDLPEVTIAAFKSASSDSSEGEE